MADLKTYSLLIAWNDDEEEEGEYGWSGRAADAEDAEAKARAAMAADDGALEEGDPPREYGRVIDLHEGAIWKAADMEKALRAIVALAPETCPVFDGDLSQMEDGADYEAVASHHEALGAWRAAQLARAILAEIDAL